MTTYREGYMKKSHAIVRTIINDSELGVRIAKVDSVIERGSVWGKSQNFWKKK